MATAEYMKAWRAKNRELNALVNRECVNRYNQRLGHVKVPLKSTIYNAEVYRLRNVWKCFI
jgi:hypothetical protein